MTPRIEVFDDGDELAATVAGELLTRLVAAMADGRDPHVGLTGGGIADRIHQDLGRRGTRSEVDWGRVHFWWGDERFVAFDSPDRNARQAHWAFLEHLPVDPAKVHEVPASDQAATVDDAASAYSSLMREQGAGLFEVLMLGLGPDGHVASLFPGHPALDVDDRIAVGVRDSPKPPPERVSLTFGALNRSRAVWFAVSGEEKADAVARALADEGDVHETPARGVTGSDDRTEIVWYLDRAAASRLPK